MDNSTATVLGRITRLTIWSLYAQFAISIVSLISHIMEWRLLEDMEAGRFADEDTMMRAADGNDLRQLVIAWIEIGIFIVSAILIMRWIYNANRNVRALGATGMAITPGWSVGWFFVPFANLVMPYRAMSELWRASASPSRWNTEEAPPLLPWWWFSLLVSGWLAQAAFRYSRKAETIDAMQTVGILSMLSNVAGLLALLALIRIIQRVFAMQASVTTSGLDRPEDEVLSDPPEPLAS